jgi:site-specific recombinase XerD
MKKKTQGNETATKEKEQPVILQLIKKLNAYNDKIKIRARPKFDNDKNIIAYITFLDLYKGRDAKREISYLDKSLHLIGNKSSLQKDRETLERIRYIRDQRQIVYKDDISGIQLRDRKKDDFLSYMLKHSISKYYICVYNHFIKFVNRDRLSFDEITPVLCEDFKNYLIKKGIKNNSIKDYIIKLKTILNKAVKDDILLKNPAENISIKTTETKREFLTENEIRLLLKTPQTNSEICNAFLFSCFTGLRYSDIDKLKFSDIKNDNGNKFIEFTQKKTGHNERFLLSENAINILDTQYDKAIRNEYVFTMFTLRIIEDHLKKWTARAGITKHITFHCGRHTFATMQLNNGNDLYTVSKLLGHKDITTTQIYAKLINKTLEQAILKQPKFEFTPEAEK